MKYRLSNSGGDGNSVDTIYTLTKEQEKLVRNLFETLNDAPCDSIWKPFLHIMTEDAHQAEQKRMKRAEAKAIRAYKKKEAVKRAAIELAARKQAIGC